MDSFNDPWATPPNLADGLSTDQMDSLAELHENAFEPQIRARSNTWPLPRPENESNDDNESNNQKTNNQQSSGEYWTYEKRKNRNQCVFNLIWWDFIMTIKIYGSQYVTFSTLYRVPSHIDAQRRWWWSFNMCGISRQSSRQFCDVIEWKLHDVSNYSLHVDGKNVSMYDQGSSFSIS